MNKRNYTISKNAGDKMYTCYVIDNNGLESINYFETKQECINHVYWKWENEAFFQQNSDKLLAKAIQNCIELDKKNGLIKRNYDNLD